MLRPALNCIGLGSIALLVAALYLHSQPALLASVLCGAAALLAKVITLTPMDQRERLHARAAPYLESGEVIQAAFTALGGPGPYVLAIVLVVNTVLSSFVASAFSPLFMIFVIFSTTQWCIVATDRAILLLKSFPGGRGVLETRLPRSTRLGPVSGGWAMIRLNGTRMFVHRRSHAEVESADNLIPQPELPERPNPVPDRPARGRTGVSLRFRSRRGDR